MIRKGDWQSKRKKPSEYIPGKMKICLVGEATELIGVSQAGFRGAHPDLGDRSGAFARGGYSRREMASDAKTGKGGRATDALRE